MAEEADSAPVTGLMNSMNQKMNSMLMNLMNSMNQKWEGEKKPRKQTPHRCARCRLSFHTHLDRTAHENHKSIITFVPPLFFGLIYLLIIWLTGQGDTLVHKLLACSALRCRRAHGSTTRGRRSAIASEEQCCIAVPTGGRGGGRWCGGP